MAEDGLVRSPFTINKTTTGVTYVAADFADASSWTTILTYAVPLGTAVEITPANYVFGLFYNTGGVTSGNVITGGLTRILKANATTNETREIWSGSNAIFGSLGDELQRPRLKTGVTVSASQQILVQVYNLGTTLDVSTSNFFIEAVQVYEQI